MVVATQQSLRGHPVQWLTASPFWEGLSSAANRSKAIKRPALLRFASDTFMEDFLTVATTTPERLKEWKVQKETWRRPMASPPDTNAPDPELADEPLKLYQPAHQRFYLVTANLVCRIPGLPDRTLNFGKGERVGFVLRRRMQDISDKQVKEHALVNGTWQPLETAQVKQLMIGEQTNPMFPVTYTEADGYQRRMFAGLVPVSGREAFMNAGRQSAVKTSSNVGVTNKEKIKRLSTVFAMDVIEPWRNINREVVIDNKTGLAKRTINESLNKIAKINNLNDRKIALKNLEDAVENNRDRLQMSSWYILLDFAIYLKTYLNSVWQAILNPSQKKSLSLKQLALFNALDNTQFESGDDINTDYLASQDVTKNKFKKEYYALIEGKSPSANSTKLTEALVEVYKKQTELETIAISYPDGQASNWPSQKFLLCGETVIGLVEKLRTLVSDALSESLSLITTPIPLIPNAKEIASTIEESDYDNDRFVIRCVYERPNCPPSLRPTVVSEPSEAFQMASYFDPDAPARPIRIPLPVDTTPAGLRKFAKNTMFVMSDTLACQVGRARSLSFGDLVRSVLPWPFHDPLPAVESDDCKNGASQFGRLCTLSIPIITVCALILLIIIVQLLDVIFKWVPYLIFCLPLPGLKAKKRSPS